MIDTPSSIAPDRRPAVGRAVSDRLVWIFAGAAVIGGGLLFGALESRRTSLTAPAIAPEPESAGAMIAPPPELALPPAWQEQPQVAPTLAPPPPRLAPPITQPAPRAYAREPAQVAAPPVTISTPSPQPTAQHDAHEVVFRAQPNSSTAKPDTQAGTSGKSERVEASRFANPTTTVPKGTVMQAVLESALDSTRAGMARAIISRDIYGFDGTKILIPRGSRLIGEYKADVQQGQSRALIEWQRLMRPDGALINLDSPSADPLGRAGIKGKVNSHFFARYSGAILQSALEIGDQVAVNKLAPGSTIYALPSFYGLQGATQGIGQQTGSTGSTIQPTLTVKQGTSVSVFVARDLDFTSVEP
jgi:type IV secretion system protein VirB10